MRKLYPLFILCLAWFQGHSQSSVTPVQPSAGIPGACGYGNSQLNTQNPTPQNGNGTLGQSYILNKCGLNYVAASQKLGKRFSPAGVNQPAAFAISGIPTCATIEKAYIWASVSGNGIAATATVTNPASSTQSYPMTIIGSGPDKCWSYSGTYTYRADVTASISGNGNYLISGLPTNPPNAGNDADGATLMIIYSDPTAAYQGSIIIHDGCVVINGGATTQTITGFNVCANATLASGFLCVGDLQGLGATLSINGGPSFGITEDWWNYVQQNTTVTSGQTTSNFNVTSSSDCFNFCVMGLYYRTTTCTTCPTSSASMSATATSTPASCSACNGSATVNVTTGSPPYTYSWNTTPVQTTATATNLCPGTYTVTVSGSCASTTATVTVSTAGGGLSINATKTNVTCFGQCNGTATATPSGGSPPYTYSWNTTPAQNTQTATGLCPGSYTCTVTDAAGCTGTASVTITQPPQLTITVTGTATTCYNQCNGSATSNVSGGTPPYTYLWNTSPVQTTQNISNLCAGTYSLTVTDANGCIANATVTITQPTQLTLSVAGFAPTCNGGCNGQTVVIPSGGTQPYTYLWSSSGCTTPSCNNLCAGTYSVTVTDATGCTATSSVVVTQPAPLAFSFTTVAANCGQATGSATVAISGGTGPYSPVWNTVPQQTGNTATNLLPGTYWVVVTDFNNCVDSASVTVPNSPGITVSICGTTNATCNGTCDGTANVCVTGGTAPYTYSWSSAPAQTTSTATGLCAGTYTATVTDANGCSDTISVIITEPAPLILTSAGATTICIGQGAQVTASATGGTAAYVFDWDNGTFTGSSYSVSPTVTTTYNVVCTDANGCTTSPQAVTITVNPPLTAIAAGATNVCPGGQAQISASGAGGDGTYTYTWLPAPVGTGSPVTVTPQQTTTYTVILTDGCGTPADSDLVTITVSPLPTVSFTAPSMGCDTFCTSFVDQSAIASGTIANWSWDFGDGSPVSTQQNPSHCYTPAGSYNVTLTVTSNAGCTSTLTTPNMITVVGSPIVDFSLGPQPATLFDGPICFTDQSTGAVSWSWDFSDPTDLTTSIQQNPCHQYNDTGSYCVELIATNSTGCRDSIVHCLDISPDFVFWIPNAFTPNNDGFNDLFSGEGMFFTNYEMRIFDRWGNMVYYTDDINKKWDGRANGGSNVAQEDVYVYVVTLVDIFDKKHKYIGHVSLIK